MKTYIVQPSLTPRGEMRVPGDKSISHRAVMLGAIAAGATEINNFLAGEDCLATIHAMQAMGVPIEGPDNGQVIVHGVGKHGLKTPEGILNLGNSGTSLRLLAGLLAGYGLPAIMEGDSSLMVRPMMRVIEPLTQMGASIHATAQGTPPLVLSTPRKRLRGQAFTLTVASAQVKSALLLAALYAEGETSITEPAVTRDHTERMLQAFGYPIQRTGLQSILSGGSHLRGTVIDVPGDISSAAFFIAAAAMTPGAELVVRDVGFNPTRIGALNILWDMGANITVGNLRSLGTEPIADLHIIGTQLRGIEIAEAQVPLAIDEFPALLIAAANATGTTVLRGAAELRVKETDRIQAMGDGLRALGINAETTADGMIVTGGEIQGGEVDSRGDHRIAMAFAMAGFCTKNPITIAHCDNVATSFPNFVEVARHGGLRLRVKEA